MNRSQGGPGAPPRPGQRVPGVSQKGPQAPPRAQNRGCLGAIFMDITGISFLSGMKKRLGGPGFLLAFFGVLLFMFILGAKIERYGHLGEHPYVMQILPAASCFSPILALLMTFAFAIGDCLTNATYWLFPQSSILNFYTLFGKAHPLLTWGAYARMDFFTLPAYALLPGMGSRILYTVASRVFQAGRAKIMKDGGADGGGSQKALDDAMKQQQQLAGREQEMLNRVDAVEGKMASAQDRRTACGQREAAAAESVQRTNEVTQEANARARAESEAAAKTATEAQQTKAMADEMARAKATAERGREQAANAVAASEERGRQLGEAKAGLDDKLGANKARMAEANNESFAAANQKAHLEEMLTSGVDENGAPLTPEKTKELDAALEDAKARLADAQGREAKLFNEKKTLEKSLEENEKASKAEQERLEAAKKEYEKRSAEAEKRAHDEQLLRDRERKLQEEARAHKEAEQAARQQASRSAQEATARQQRLQEAQRERLSAERELKGLSDQRNQLAGQYNEVHKQRLAVDERISDIQEKMGGAPAQGVSSQSRSRRRADSTQEFIRRYDAAMYAEMARQQRERDMLIRSLQQQNRGLLPSGLPAGEVAGVGTMAGQGLATMGAAVIGAAAGGALGAGLLHGHMWAEYNPIREWVHPSHTADVGCYKMDVGYLDQNLMSGVGTSMALGPAVAVVGADPGVAPPPGPSTPQVQPPSEGPSDWSAPGTAPGGGPQRTPEEQEALDEAAKARAEAEKYKEQFVDSESSADKSDPNYESVKKQYEDYIKSQEDKAADAEARAKELSDEREAKEAEERDAAERKSQWVASRQDDLKALEEEKAHLLGVMAGVQQAGMDSSEHQRRLNEINTRLGDLHGQLQKEGSDIDYQARDRGVIGVGKEFSEMDQKAHEQKDLLDKLQQMQKTAFKEGMLEPGADGTRGDIYGKLGTIIDDLVSGKSVDMEKIRMIREHMGGRIDGSVGDPSRPPAPEKPWYVDGENWRNAFEESARNLSTCRSGDGSFSWSGLGGRVGIGILTLGASEWVFVPAGALYTTKDAVDRGADGLEAWREGMSETIKQELIGKAFGGLVHIGGGMAKGMAKGAWAAGEAGEGLLKGGLKGGVEGGWSGLKQFGSEMAKEGGEFISKEGWKRAGSELGKSVSGGINRLDNLLTGKEGFELGFGKAGAEGAAAGAKAPLIGTPEWAKQQQVRRAIATGDPDVVAGLYRDGGMKDLVEMQKAGYIRPEEARGLNQLVQNQVNDSIRSGTRNSIIEFQDKNGVRMEELIVGDSGSSARGAPTRLKTDADRTLVPKFNEADLDRYAHNNNMSREQAYDELCQKFKDTHEANVAEELRSRGFGNTNDPNLGSARDNVGYGSYDRIGASSGQCDSYAEGFTNARQAGQGSGEVYKGNPDGSVSDPYRVSGQTVVDQNRLNRATYGGDAVPEDATRIPPSEIPSVLNQQTNAIGHHPNDPLTVAKAVGRTEKVANTVGESLQDPRLTQAAKEIYEDPGKMNEVLKHYGYVDGHGNPDPSAFCREGGGAVGSYSDSFNSIRPGGPPPTR